MLGLRDSNVSILPFSFLALIPSECKYHFFLVQIDDCADRWPQSRRGWLMASPGLYGSSSKWHLILTMFAYQPQKRIPTGSACIRRSPLGQSHSTPWELHMVIGQIWIISPSLWPVAWTVLSEENNWKTSIMGIPEQLLYFTIIECSERGGLKWISCPYVITSLKKKFHVKGQKLFSKCRFDLKKRKGNSLGMRTERNQGKSEKLPLSVAMWFCIGHRPRGFRARVPFPCGNQNPVFCRLTHGNRSWGKFFE